MIWRINFKDSIGRCLLSNYRHFSRSVNHYQQMKTKGLLKTGLVIEGFKVDQTVDISDFNCKLIRLEHVDTGAQYTHIDRNDTNNVFAIAFRTTPFDSSGLPHILEHITLMGSEKYPCRDPFFKMLNRSMATFLNALTYPDFTIYPLATQSHVDYYNLMSVYLDAVFRPKLRENDFKMEGWRLEHEDVNDKNSPIVFKGVVFNEMKGVYSENQNIFMEHLLNNTLPSHTYGVNSGGNPFDIPSLTYEKLVDFQKNHYHPSNGRMYSYGNLDLLDHLKFINANYLKDFERCDEYAKRTTVPLEPRWIEPRRKHVFGKNDPLAADQNKQSMLAISYLCEDIRNVYETFELKILAKLLIEGPNSHFYKNLIEPNIGSGYAPTTGYDTSTRDTIFNVGLQALNNCDFEKVESIIYSTFEECISVGFTDTVIENVLHGIELGIKHQGTDFGLNLMFNLAPLWNHDGDLEAAMKVSEHINRFRKNLEDKFYLQRLVDKYFNSNSHRLILTMSPNENYEEEIKQKEQNLLQQKCFELGEAELAKIYDTGLELRRDQEKKEDISCLPTLKVSDISKDYKAVDLTYLDLDVPAQVCRIPTNNVVYFRALIDASDLSSNAKTLLPLFAEVMSQMGTENYDYRQFSLMVQNKTDGLNCSLHVTDDVKNANTFEEALCLGSLCLDRNTEAMFNLWSVLLNEVTLNDVDRFSTLVRNTAGDVVNGVADSGHRYAMLNASSRVCPANYRREQFSGLTYIQKIKEIASCDDLSHVLCDIRNIATHLLNKKRMRCALNVAPEQDMVAVEALNNFVVELKGNCEGNLSKRCDTLQENMPCEVHYVLPFSVNFCAKSIQCVPFIHPDFAALRVLSKLLTTKYLLPLIRERYGAYGAGAAMSMSGTLQFYSYRDPNTVGTMNIFDDSTDWLKKNEFTDIDIDEAKLGVFREVDCPIAPSDQGMRLFLSGLSHEYFAQHRLQIFDINRDSLLNVGAKYLGLHSAKVLIGPENKEMHKWQKIYSE